MNLSALDYQRDARPFPVVGALLLLMGLSGLSVLALYDYRLENGISDWEESLHKFERVDHRRLEKKHAAFPKEEMARARGVLDRLSLPWNDLFSAVEQAEVKDVALLGLEPEAGKKILKIEAEARNLEAMLAYEKKLQSLKEFREVYLHRHGVAEQDPEKPVRFSVLATWQGSR